MFKFHYWSWAFFNTNLKLKFYVKNSWIDAYHCVCRTCGCLSALDSKMLQRRVQNLDEFLLLSPNN